MSWVPFATAPLKLHCSTKNLTRHFFHQAIRKAWLPSLIASLMRVMDHLSLLLATAPQRFAGGGPGSCACRAEGYGFARVDSVRGNGVATPGKYLRYSLQHRQPARS